MKKYISSFVLGSLCTALIMYCTRTRVEEPVLSIEPEAQTYRFKTMKQVVKETNEMMNYMRTNDSMFFAILLKDKK